jgi:hypothetical protein
VPKLPSSKIPPEIYKVVYFGAAGSGKRSNLQQMQKLLRLEAPLAETPIPETPIPEAPANAITLKLPSSSACSKPVVVSTIEADCASSMWLTLLRDVHGVVFVADSDRARHEDNVQAMTALIAKLSTFRIKIEAFPVVIQYNKRDLSNVMAIPQMEEELNPLGLPAFNAVATTGLGVAETVNAVSFLIEHGPIL